MYARLNGPWKDKSDGVLDLTEFDEHTIECCLCYFYRRTYCPYNVIPKPEPEVGTAVKAESPESDGTKDNQTHGSKSGDEQVYLTRANTDSPLNPLESMIELRPHAKLKKQETSEKSHEVLVTDALVHARVYAFAHMYIFPELETYALHRLGETLIALQQHKVNMPLQLANAARVIYGSTPDASYNPARELLSRFVALNFSFLLGESLDQLLQEGGDFAVDVSRKLARDYPPKLWPMP